MARPRQISDEDILDATRACLFEHGPSVSTDVIASQLGVSSQALLKRFSTKRELILAAVRPPAIPPWTELVNAGPDDRPLREQLQEIVDEVSVYFTDVVKRVSIIRWSGIPMEELARQYDVPPPLVGIPALANWLKRAHAAGMIRKVDYKASALSLLGSMHAPAFLTDILGKHPTGHSRSRYAREIVDLFARGLEPVPESSPNANKSVPQS